MDPTNTATPDSSTSQLECRQKTAARWEMAKDRHDRHDRHENRHEINEKQTRREKRQTRQTRKKQTRAFIIDTRRKIDTDRHDRCPSAAKNEECLLLRRPSKDRHGGNFAAEGVQQCLLVSIFVCLRLLGGLGEQPGPGARGPGPCKVYVYVCICISVYVYVYVYVLFFLNCL